MKDIKIHVYSKPDETGGWIRTISTEDWIVFEHKDGSLTIGRRDPITEPNGATVGELLVLDPLTA